MKTINVIFNIFLLLLLLMVINYFLKVVTVPEWITLAILVVSALLYAIRTYLRFKTR